MGCFEMRILRLERAKSRINFNMGCFEIIVPPIKSHMPVPINFNMGCFEILERKIEEKPDLR